jgi:adenylate kinase family enzyme
MQKIVIFGNSGSGKSTLARAMAEEFACPSLDLDTVAWESGRETPSRRSLADSEKEIEAFLANRSSWVIEGCYSDLLTLVLPHSSEIIFLNPGTETCIKNCRNRPWEPHKYDSPDAQNANLNMLITWIEKYETREDEFSLKAHRKIFTSYPGRKREYSSNVQLGSVTLP